MSLTPERKPRFPTRVSKAIGVKMQRDRRYEDRRQSDRRSRLIDRLWLLAVTLLWVWAITSLQHQQSQQNRDRVNGTRQRCELPALNIQTLELSIATSTNPDAKVKGQRLIAPYKKNLADCEKTLGQLSPAALREFRSEHQ
jgi:hypothetical protein